MLGFYRRIFLSAISEFQSVKSKALLWSAIGLSVVGFFNQQLADKISHTWSGVSRWWSVAPIGLFVAYRLLQANYEAFSALEQRVRVRQEEEQLQSALGELLADGADLRVDFIENASQLSPWIGKFNRWRQAVLDALGNFGLAADYALFQNADAMGDVPPIGATMEWTEQVREYDHILRNHLRALAGILRTRPKIAFEPQELHERERF